MFTILDLGYDFSNEILLIRRKFHFIRGDKLILSPDLDVSSDILHLIFDAHILYSDVDRIGGSAVENIARRLIAKRG